MPGTHEKRHVVMAPSPNHPAERRTACARPSTSTFVRRRINPKQRTDAQGASGRQLLELRDQFRSRLPVIEMAWVSLAGRPPICRQSWRTLAEHLHYSSVGEPGQPLDRRA